MRTSFLWLFDSYYFRGDDEEEEEELEGETVDLTAEELEALKTAQLEEKVDVTATKVEDDELNIDDI